MKISSCSTRRSSYLKRCDCCGDRIPRGAAVCRQCRNFQGGRWWFRLVGLALPWLTAALTVGYFSLKEFHTFFVPLKSDIYFSSEVTRGKIRIEIFNKHDSSIYIDGSFFVCNLKAGADRKHYFSLNVGDIIPDSKIDSGIKKLYRFDLPLEAIKSLSDPAKFCKISLLASDYDGKEAIVAITPINLDAIKIDGRFLGEDGK